MLWYNKKINEWNKASNASWTHFCQWYINRTYLPGLRKFAKNSVIRSIAIKWPEHDSHIRKGIKLTSIASMGYHKEMTVLCTRVASAPRDNTDPTYSTIVQSRKRSIAAVHPRHRVITCVRTQTRLSANTRDPSLWHIHAAAWTRARARVCKYEYIIVHKHERDRVRIAHVHSETGEEETCTGGRARTRMRNQPANLPGV